MWVGGSQEDVENSAVEVEGLKKQKSVKPETKMVVGEIQIISLGFRMVRAIDSKGSIN